MFAWPTNQNRLQYYNQDIIKYFGIIFWPLNDNKNIYSVWYRKTWNLPMWNSLVCDLNLTQWISDWKRDSLEELINAITRAKFVQVTPCND